MRARASNLARADESPYYMPNHHHHNNKRKQEQGLKNERVIKQYNGGFPASVTTSGFKHFPPQVQPESTEESNSESFRSVIDDLTIKSTNLRRHPTHLYCNQISNKPSLLFLCGYNRPKAQAEAPQTRRPSRHRQQSSRQAF